MAVIRCLPFNISHDGLSIQRALEQIVTDWGIASVHIILRDNASNNIKACGGMKADSLGCLAHALHLIVTHAIKNTREPEQTSEENVYEENTRQPLNQLVLR